MHPSAETMIASLIFGNSLNLSNPWFWNISTAASAAAGLLDLSSSRPTFSDCKRYQNVGFFVATISWWGEVMMGVWRDHQQGTTPQALVQAAAAVYYEMCPSVTPQSNTSTEIIFNTRLGMTMLIFELAGNPNKEKAGQCGVLFWWQDVLYILAGFH